MNNMFLEVPYRRILLDIESYLLLYIRGSLYTSSGNLLPVTSDGTNLHGDSAKIILTDVGASNGV